MDFSSTSTQIWATASLSTIQSEHFGDVGNYSIFGCEPMFSVLLWFITTIAIIQALIKSCHNCNHNQCQCLNLFRCSEYSRCKWTTIAGTSQPRPILWASRESGKNTRSWPRTPLSGFISPSLNGTTWTGDIFGLNPLDQEAWIGRNDLAKKTLTATMTSWPASKTVRWNNVL